MIDQGDTYVLAATFTDATGTAVDPASVTLSLTLPDGTSASLVPVRQSVGQYSYSYPTSQAGRHVAVWLATGPSSAYSDVFDVSLAGGAIVSLVDAKQHMRVTSTGDDEQIRSMIESATQVVERIVGPCARRNLSVVLYPSMGEWLTLPHDEVLGLVSATIVRDGSVVPNLYAMRADRGVLRTSDYSVLPVEPWTLTYTVGRVVIPANIRLATLIIIKHLWDTQRGGSQSARPGADDQGSSSTGAGYLIPYRALALLEPERRVLGFA